MDFVTMSRCILREGSGMWMLVDQEALDLLSTLGLQPSEGGEDACMEQSGEAPAYLRVFYALGGSAIAEHVLRARVRVLTRVAGSGLHALSVRVFDDDGVQRLHPHRPEGRAVEELQRTKPVESKAAASSLIADGD